MYKLIAVTLAAMYGVLMIFGDPADAPPVARASTGEDVGERFSFTELLELPQDTAAAAVRATSGPSDQEAVQIALKATEDWRANKTDAVQLRGLVTAAAAAPTEADATASATNFWYVTGSTVNLRSGPSTSNAVVGQVSLGDAAETLSDTSADWIQIRTANGQTGWIFGRFLGENQPG